MKPVIIVTCLFLIFNLHLYAQNNWTVKAGQEIKEAVPVSVRFRYPQFVSGNVYFKNQTTSSGLLNFNLLNEEMQFINPDGDTLSIDDEATIKYITINSDSFFYAKAYLELITSNPLVKLAKKQRLKVGDLRKIGGYDQASSVSAITSISSINTGGRYSKINQRAEILLSKEITYYIGDNYNHFLPSTKKNIMKIFGRQESGIEKFLGENKIRFNNEDDLKMLIDFLQKIQ